MRNVLALTLVLATLVLAACSSSGDGLVAPPDAAPAAAVSRGRQVTDQDTRQASQLDARTALADSLAADTLALVASPDSLPAAPDTYVAPPPPPVTWEPGPETTDPALMVCPPTKGNSLGIGAPCTVINQDVMCKKGLDCLCGGKTRQSALDASMPCFCSNYFGESTSPKAPCSGPCGEGAGCCSLDLPSGRWQRACLPTACASYCRQ